MLRHDKRAKFLAIILFERLCDLFCRLAAALFVSQHENHTLLRKSRRKHRIHRRHQHVERLVVHCHNHRMINFARLREIPLFCRRHHAKIAQMLLVIISFALRASQTIIALRRILKLRQALRPVHAHPALQKLPTLHRANRNANTLHKVHNHDQKQINRCQNWRNNRQDNQKRQHNIAERCRQHLKKAVTNRSLPPRDFNYLRHLTFSDNTEQKLNTNC